MPRTILIAEDNPDLLEVLALQFDWRGYRVLRARDGVEALAKLDLGPDLLLLDVVMPRKNGFEVCRSLKSDPARRGLPVILVSGRKAETDRQWALECGADAYVTKPFGISALELEVGRLLARGELESAESRSTEKPAEERVACRWVFDPLAARVYRQKYGELAYRRLMRLLPGVLIRHLPSLGMQGWTCRDDYGAISLVRLAGSRRGPRARLERLTAIGNDFVRSRYDPEDAAQGAVVCRERGEGGSEMRYPLLRLLPQLPLGEGEGR